MNEPRWTWRLAVKPVRTQEGRIACMRWVQTKTFPDGHQVHRTTDFTCLVCGDECISIPGDGSRGVCPEHCPDHDYEYERGERNWFCQHCGQPASEEWLCERFDPDDDRP